LGLFYTRQAVVLRGTTSVLGLSWAYFLVTQAKNGIGQAPKRHCVIFAKDAKKIPFCFVGWDEELKSIEAEKAIIFICNCIKAMPKISKRGSSKYNV
jgi:hypothetical protein